jgi:hypothetical protein
MCFWPAPRNRRGKGHFAILSRPIIRFTTLALQRDALTEAGCAKIFTEQMSGAVKDRPVYMTLSNSRAAATH